MECAGSLPCAERLRCKSQNRYRNAGRQTGDAPFSLALLIQIGCQTATSSGALGTAWQCTRQSACDWRLQLFLGGVKECSQHPGSCWEKPAMIAVENLDSGRWAISCFRSHKIHLRRQEATHHVQTDKWWHAFTCSHWQNQHTFWVH